MIIIYQNFTYLKFLKDQFRNNFIHFLILKSANFMFDLPYKLSRNLKTQWS
jgi:hypothetical protein